MLQAIGLTSTPRRGRPPAVDDLTFEARPGSVTALLGAPGSGKTTALRLMLGLEQGRGVTYFRGRPLHRVAHPAREVGALLGDVPGNPSRTARGQLRMLCAAAGVPASRADSLLDVVGLTELAGQRLGSLSLGMDRRLGLASALLADPHTLLLDEPAAGLSPRDSSWLFGLLRAHAAHGGTVLYATDDSKEAARTADRVVTLDEGRLVADQAVADFARTRLRPRVAVRTPQAVRLGALLNKEARVARRSVEVVPEEGNRLSVYGSTCAEVGDTAFRHGVLLHQLADEIGDMGPRNIPAPDPAAPAAPTPDSSSASTVTETSGAPSAPTPARNPEAVPALPTPLRPLRSPLRPLRYELRRTFSTRSTTLVTVAALAVSAALALLLVHTGGTPLPTALAAWPALLPLPPAAFAAGLLGALSFGDEFRYPALAASRGTSPRRLGLLLAKLAVSAGLALLLAVLTIAVNLLLLRLLYGAEPTALPPGLPARAASWAALCVGCAWAGLLGAGVFRVAAAGLAAVLAVPVVVAPAVQHLLTGPAARSMVGLPGRLRELIWIGIPAEADQLLLATMRLLAQPVGAALALSLPVLLCTYLLTGLRRKARW
ncbi:ATP-binding cassette domain-containing protein [Streptomyces sp. NBC_00237]|uniref:ATP-binding cassette domain-containing protein n=1 Tax=Streptomyces sp. NBC_00237 TaxID=2975687 RepID=UPI00225439E4|nr:ATP-binding cassette domain-containing protein [Streptomyces sp. NBC_00237]MCX5203747.1 ATP-binding cassette domain-containing protein [Streptomyces sp. NBC_00237]